MITLSGTYKRVNHAIDQRDKSAGWNHQIDPPAFDFASRSNT
ncbi:MAG: hypothetical protein QOG73_2714 [Acetobacteraceae bacterium]|jgi:hypothetical protein|nr:hypothetical protein [Acetobacteraceae bacterium]